MIKGKYTATLTCDCDLCAREPDKALTVQIEPSSLEYDDIQKAAVKVGWVLSFYWVRQHPQCYHTSHSQHFNPKNRKFK